MSDEPLEFITKFCGIILFVLGVMFIRQLRLRSFHLLDVWGALSTASAAISIVGLAIAVPWEAVKTYLMIASAFTMIYSVGWLKTARCRVSRDEDSRAYFQDKVDSARAVLESSDEEGTWSQLKSESAAAKPVDPIGRLLQT